MVAGRKKTIKKLGCRKYRLLSSNSKRSPIRAPFFFQTFLKTSLHNFSYIINVKNKNKRGKATMKNDEISKALAEVAQEVCMKSLKEKDRDLNLTGKCKKCYNCLAEQFIRNYIDGKTMTTVMYDTMGDRFYNTWLVFLGIVRCIVRDDGKFHGIENIINNSGISRKTWVKFFDSLPKR